MRPLNTTRDQDGEFVSLVLPMRSLDEERHFQYFRMSAPKFDDLVSRVIPYLPDSHQNHRNPEHFIQIFYCKYNIVEIMYTRPHRQRIVLHGSARRVSKIGTTRFATHRRIMAAEA